MIAVDVTNPIEVRATCIRLLNEGVGVDVAQAFMKQCFGGRGDYTAEKQARPPKSDGELALLEEQYESESAVSGTMASYA